MDEPSAAVPMNEMFALLRKVDLAVQRIADNLERLEDTVGDHEERIRTIESREDLSRRVNDLEHKLDQIRMRVWAFPSLAGIAAVIAIFAAFSDKL